ncbi:hypothetical protein [Streptomyces roseolus]|uniref:hypothetical protein n=1 Tax=Streptomyces roseolus TaxID=67358 RepID=UPI00167296A0|nr:hypothetical protein [Streptomyces roseolus]
MARMRRGIVHVLAWSLATGAAVTLSWWGVHTVLSGTVYDPPRALPLPVGPPEDPAPAGTAIGDPVTASTRRPSPPPAPPSSPAPSSPSPASSSSSAPGTAAAPSTRPAAPPSATAGSSVRTTSVDGGRVTFDLGESSAELVSAIPASGWRMQVWKQPSWIRVTFTRGDREVSVFCVWHDSAPRVEVDDRTN